MVRIIIVYAEVGGKSESRVVGISAVKEFQCYATAQTIGDVVGIRASESNIFRRKIAHYGAVGKSFLHRPIAKILQRSRPSATLADAVPITHSGKIRAPDIVHVVEGNLSGHLPAQQGRVLVGGLDVVIDKRDIHPAQAIYAAR